LPNISANKRKAENKNKINTEDTYEDVFSRKIFQLNKIEKFFQKIVDRQNFIVTRGDLHKLKFVRDESKLKL